MNINNNYASVIAMLRQNLADKISNVIQKPGHSPLVLLSGIPSSPINKLSNSFGGIDPAYQAVMRALTKYGSLNARSAPELQSAHGSAPEESSLDPQDAQPAAEGASPEEQKKAARDNAQERIKQIMGNYDPEDGDADAKAEQIANDAELSKYLTKEQRAQLIRGLFDGSTDDDEEEAAMKLLRSASGEDVKWIVGNIGWETLEDELKGDQLDQIPGLLAQSTPANSSVHSAIGELGLTPSDLGVPMKELLEKVKANLNGKGPEEINQLAERLLAMKDEVLKEIAEMERRGLQPKALELKQILDLVTKQTSGELQADRHEAIRLAGVLHERRRGRAGKRRVCGTLHTAA
jgi:hypothetical protein